MNTMMRFIKTTIVGGLLFLIPVVLIVVLLGKAFSLLRPLLRPLVDKLNVETVLGVAVLTMLTGVVLCMICFIAGLLIRLNRVKVFAKNIEELILRYVPGFEYLKVIAGERTGDSLTSNWKPVLMAEGEGWVIAFIVEEHANGYTTVFIPEAPRADSGNAKTIVTSQLKTMPLTMREALNYLRHYGAGVGQKLETSMMEA